MLCMLMLLTKRFYKLYGVYSQYCSKTNVRMSDPGKCETVREWIYTQMSIIARPA